MNKDVKIYIACHKAGPIIHSECLIPIQAGRAIAKTKLDNMIGDDTGENISQKNGSWCELSILYWMWKNVDTDYYGLFHYRRLLNFRKGESDYCQFFNFTEEEIERFGWNDNLIREFCSQYDIITGPIWNIHPFFNPNNIMTAYDYYGRDHYIKDLDIVIDIIKDKYPNIYPYVLQSLYSTSCFFFNIAIMKKEYFHGYCKWLFDVLFEAEKKIDITSYDPYQKRIWGFIAERMINAYYFYLLQTNKDIKVTNLGIAFGILDKPYINAEKILETIENKKEIVRKIKTDEFVNVAFAIDDNYVIHCATTIRSLIDYIHPEQVINIYILHDENFSIQSKALLKTLEENKVSINLININSSEFSAYPLNRSHISIATYYRLILQDILPEEVEKIIYLDSDIIVTDNIVNLWNIDIGNNYIGAVCDEGDLLQVRRLGLPYPHKYINAGICIFNLKEIRKIKNISSYYLECFFKNKSNITLQDQDIINIAFCNKIKNIPLAWNVQSRMFKFNELDHSFSSNESYAAANNPSIIHYSDIYKPWKPNCEHPLKVLYKEYREKLSISFKSVKTSENIIDFISYQILGDQVEVFFHFFNKKRKIIISKKMAKRINNILQRLVK